MTTARRRYTWPPSLASDGGGDAACVERAHPGLTPCQYADVIAISLPTVWSFANHGRAQVMQANKASVCNSVVLGGSALRRVCDSTGLAWLRPMQQWTSAWLMNAVRSQRAKLCIRYTPEPLEPPMRDTVNAETQCMGQPGSRAKRKGPMQRPCVFQPCLEAGTVAPPISPHLSRSRVRLISAPAISPLPAPQLRAGLSGCSRPDRWPACVECELHVVGRSYPWDLFSTHAANKHIPFSRRARAQ